MYWQGPCECSMCGHNWRCVAELAPGQQEPIYGLECPNCHNMTGHASEGSYLIHTKTNIFPMIVVGLFILFFLILLGSK